MDIEKNIEELYNDWIIEIEKIPLHEEIYTKMQEIERCEDFVDILRSVLSKLDNTSSFIISLPQISLDEEK